MNPQQLGLTLEVNGLGGRRSVSATLRLRYFLKSQKPASLTCEKARLPAPSAAANVFVTAGSERPRVRPGVTVAMRSAVGITTSGSAVIDIRSR